MGVPLVVLRLTWAHYVEVLLQLKASPHSSRQHTRHQIDANMPEESTQTDPKVDEAAIQELVDTKPQDSLTDEDGEEEETADTASPDALAACSTARKKKSKKAKLKKALGVGNNEDKEAASSSNPASKLTTSMVEQLLVSGKALGATRNPPKPFTEIETISQHPRASCLYL